MESRDSAEEGVVVQGKSEVLTVHGNLAKWMGEGEWGWEEGGGGGSRWDPFDAFFFSFGMRVCASCSVALSLLTLS